MNGATVKWLISVAKLYGVAVVTSVAIRDKGGYFNRMMFVTPEGHIQWYDKRHLFRMGEENQHYMSGDKRVIVNYKGCRFLLQVCYDLRFPVWSRNRNDYDAIIYVANWPEVRNAAWEILLNTPMVTKLISDNRLDKLPDVIAGSVNEGMSTFNQSLLNLVNNGLITEEDALEASDKPDALRMNFEGIFLSADGGIIG